MDMSIHIIMKIDLIKYRGKQKIDEFNPENNEEKTETNVRVKFNQKYGEKSFTRAIYPSDVKETQDKDFSVKVVYKITLKMNQEYYILR